MLWVPPVTEVGAILTEGEIFRIGTKPGNCQKVALGIVSTGKIVEIPVMPLLSHVTFFSIRVDSDVSVFQSDSSPSVEMDAGKGLYISSDSFEGFVVQLVKTEMVPAQSIKRVRVRTQLLEGTKFSLSYFSPVDHSKLLEIDDQLVEIDKSGFFDLLLVNNADQDI